MNVSCEACHGPGSAHVAWAQAGADRRPIPAKGLTRAAARPRRRPVAVRRRCPDRHADDARWPRRPRREVCAPCHARRSPLGDGRDDRPPLLDAYRPSLLDPGLYHADGQIDGEVYNYGSFLQSRMYRGRRDLLRLPRAAQPAAARRGQRGLRPVPPAGAPSTWPSTTTTRRASPAANASTATCRRRPTWWSTRGTITASRCRARPRQPDRRAGRLHRLPCGQGRRLGRRAHRRMVRVRPAPRAGFGEALAADRRANPAPAPAWSSSPAIRTARDRAGDRRGRRSSAISTSPPSPPSSAASPTRTRWSGWPPSGPWAGRSRLRAELALPLLADPVRRSAWRRPASWRPYPPVDLPPDQRAALDAAFADYESAQGTLLDRPEGLITLANFYRERGRLVEAEARLADSIRLHPAFVPAYANLADLMRQQGRDAEGERVLEQGLAMAPASAELTHAKGLLLIRQQKYRRSRRGPGKAADLAPDNPRYAYVYAVALQETGRPGDAGRSGTGASSATPRRSGHPDGAGDGEPAARRPGRRAGLRQGSGPARAERSDRASAPGGDWPRRAVTSAAQAPNRSS